jgi:hypothetical protein
MELYSYLWYVGNEVSHKLRTMEAENKIKIIERFDAYYSGINNKGAFILAINTFVISGMLIGLKDLQSMISCNEINVFKILIGLIIFLSLASMILTISAIIPYLNSDKKSLWFFNDVANRNKEEFLNEIETQTEEAQNADINEQIHYLSLGLKRKHNKIRVALILNFIQMFLLGFLTYLILT